MKTPQLLSVALALVVAAPACNHADANREAREAAAEVRTVASAAGVRLADSWLTTKVQAQFFADDDIKARYITVTTRDGVVTLKGYVESDDVRRQALQIANNTDGVRQIQDQLLVGRPGTAGFEAPTPVATGGGDPVVPVTPTAIDDATIATSIQAQYFLESAVKGRDITVGSKGGVVTLRGRVGSDYERAQALVLARTTEGVQRVEDGLTVDASLAATQPTGTSGVLPSTSVPGATTATPIVPSAEASIEQRLRKQISGVEITVTDGVVLLQGTVPDQASKQRALKTAREAEGVVQVVDRLTIAKK